MAITLPHVFQDGVGEVASGVQVDENFNVLKAAIEALESLRLTSQTYSAKAASTINTPHAVSGTRPAFVVLSYSSPIQPPTIEAKVFIDGIEVSQVAEVGEEGQRFFTTPFLLKPNGTWELRATGAWAVNVSALVF